MFFRDSHHHGERVLTAFGRRDKGLGMSRWLSPLRVLKYSHAPLEFNNLPFDLNVNLIVLAGGAGKPAAETSAAPGNV